MQGTGKFGRAGKEVNNAHLKAQSYSSLSPEHRQRPNRRLQLTAFGARDRAFFEVVLCGAPRRQLKRNTLGRFQC